MMREPITGRCSGHCCQHFTLPWPDDQLPNILWAHKAGAVAWQDPEWLFIVNMTVPIHQHDPLYRFTYTCRHFDQPSGNCTIYDDRPEMCRNYPYGRRCEDPDCTLVQLIA